jgi:hypothetical protein
VHSTGGSLKAIKGFWRHKEILCEIRLKTLWAVGALRADPFYGVTIDHHLRSMDDGPQKCKENHVLKLISPFKLTSNT